MDFDKANYTAIVSDLHLCEAEPVRAKNPLWKKFKTKEFFYDETFAEFLNYLDCLGGNESVELILNGDIFDFDSVTVYPNDATFRVSWLERRRGLFAQEEKTIYKIEVILSDHEVLFRALSQFVKKGNRIVFVAGNHDLGLHFLGVQQTLLERLNLTEEERGRVRFNEWFYISNKDTLIEHGNQYDPYCVCQDPISPFIQKYNHLELRLPFGNLACQYMVNGMGLINPHVDSNYLMTVPEYLKFYLKYLLRTQPLVVWTWIWGASIILIQSLNDRLKPPLRDPLTIEDRVREIARKANATPRMVRELKALFAAPAESDPYLVARELWLDQAFMVLVIFYLVFVVFTALRSFFAISYLWILIPMVMFFPFFVFYSKTIVSEVASFMEPKEKVLTMASMITGVTRIVYGHSHIIRHEIIGAVEHLNAGCWSPAFTDVECTQPIDQKTFVLVEPGKQGVRIASVKTFVGKNNVQEAFHQMRGTKTRRKRRVS